MIALKNGTAFDVVELLASLVRQPLCFMSLWLAMMVPAAHAEENFAAWVAAFKQEAQTQGISQTTLDTALDHVQPIQRIIDMESSQPEFRQTFLGYLQKRVNARAIATGKGLLDKHQKLFAEVERRYEVPRAVLVALWSMETNYGANLGDFDTISALATLAYEGRRRDFFRGQLLAAMRILDGGHVDLQAMRGSWAGAMGHMQFMPSTFLAYATDGDNDGRIDLRQSLPDAMFSAANYLKLAGWRMGEPIAIEVSLPENFDFEEAQLTHRVPVAEWSAIGVKPIGQTNLPVVSGNAAIILPQGWRGPAFMVFDNFDVVMQWNNSTSYALSVAYLADRLKDGLPLASGQNAEQTGLSIQQTLSLQQMLMEMGFDVGKADGIIGARTQAAVRSYQKAQGLPVDGYASPSLFEHMQAGVRSTAEQKSNHQVSDSDMGK